MTLDEYQQLASRTINQDLTWAQVDDHALHGMSAEIGEIHGIYQKRYQGHNVNDWEMMKELGDLLWFCAEFATAHGWSLDDVCQMNIDKLKIRYPDGFSAERSVNRTE